MLKWSSGIVAVMCLAVPLHSQLRPDYNVQQWQQKEHREEMAMIVTGQTEQAIEKLQHYLKSHPSDAEAMFVLAFAFSKKDKVDKAFQYCQAALNEGLPIERFLAGPRSDFGPLIQSEKFQHIYRQNPVELLHGPMLGSVTDHSAKVWVRTFHEIPVQVVISTSSEITSPVTSRKIVTRSENDYTAKIPLFYLSPNTKYYYQLKLNGELYPKIYSFTTWPQQNTDTRFSVAFGGGAAYNPHKEYIWNVIKDHAPNCLLMMGDNVYIDHPEEREVQRFCYYQRQSSRPWRRLLSTVPVAAIWDDHDFGINDDYGGPEKYNPAWKTGVLEVFQQNWANPSFANGKDTPGIWFDFIIGKAHFFMLDCRYYREPSTTENPSMLGPVQKQWLKNRLKASDATFKIIVSSVPWADEAKGKMAGRYDTWRGYPQERKEIFDFLTENEIKGVFLLAADRHRADAWQHQRENDYPLWEFETSRLTNIHVHALMPGAFLGYNKRCMFYLLEFDTTVKDPKVVAKVINNQDELIHQVTLYRSQLE